MTVINIKKVPPLDPKKKPKIDDGPKYEGPWGKDLGLT